MKKYTIDDNWKPVRIRNGKKERKIVLLHAKKLKPGQSFFVPTEDCSTSAINIWLRKTGFRKENLYILVSKIKKPIPGSRVYRRK